LANTISIIGLDKIPLVKPGDDVAQLIFDAASAERIQLLDADVIVISQKIVSKADGLLVDITKVKALARAKSIAKRTAKDSRLIQLILGDSTKVLRADSQTLIVRRKNGFICLNAGVDKSNVNGRLVYARLPEDADRSANEIRKKLEELSGRSLGVVVGDTYSRPFRVGQVEFAIGVAGIEPLVDYRGLKDLFGYRLKYKFVGLADEIAAASELVMGQGTERTPVAIVRGLTRLKRSEAKNLSAKLSLRKRPDLFREML